MRRARESIENLSVSDALGPSRRIELQQGPIHFREIGEGPPLVFVHGVFVNGDLWRRVVPLLSHRYRCITPDWPLGAHPEPMHEEADLTTPGLSKLVADFLAALELVDVTLVGNDTGGAICQLVVADHRNRVVRLVLTSCDAFDVYPPSPFGFLRVIPSVPGAAFGLAHTLRIRALRNLPIAFGWLTKRPLDPEISDSYVRPLLDAGIRRDAQKVLRGISPEHTLEAARRFADYEHPVLLAWAADDKLFPVSLAHRLAEVFPNAKVEIVPDSRTFISEDQPDRLATLIDDFVQGALH